MALFARAYTLVTDCVITNHLAPYSTVVQLQVNTLRNSLIANNKSGFAAVALTYGADASNCTFTGNESTRGDAYGGALSMSANIPFYGISFVDSCTFSNNLCTAGKGGAVAMFGDCRLRNCLINNNTNASATGWGGGVYLSNVSTNVFDGGVMNCTIVNNYSANEGGGIGAVGPSNYIVNCIIADNSSFAGNYPNVYHSDNAAANMSNYYYSCVFPASAGLLAANQGNITNDPVFVDSASGNWRLRGGWSPCIDAGMNVLSWMTNSWDLDGQIRIRYGTVDMGAYEKFFTRGSVIGIL